MAALPLPLQDFHLLAFASFAGRTHQYYRLNMAWVDETDVCGVNEKPSVRGNMSKAFSAIFEKPSFVWTYQVITHTFHQNANVKAIHFNKIYVYWKYSHFSIARGKEMLKVNQYHHIRKLLAVKGLSQRKVAKHWAFHGTLWGSIVPPCHSVK